jgi:epoxyqueuosine reductase
MNLDKRISILAKSLGADFLGVADLSAARDFIEWQGGKRMTGYPRAVVVGIRLLDTLVDLLPEHEDPAVAGLYRHQTYDVVNQTLDQIALRVANTIQGGGYRAFPVPASKRASDEKIAGIFSQKLAAHLAGLGWIGKSCLLITPDHGPRVRWVTILTDAPLQPTGTPMEPRCGKCTACVDICPVHAFTGRTFVPGEPREARFDAAACDRYFKEMENAGRPAACGMCVYICPHGRQSAEKPA